MKDTTCCDIILTDISIRKKLSVDMYIRLDYDDREVLKTEAEKYIDEEANTTVHSAADRQ